MGLSSTANLYYGIRYDAVFKTIETRQEYDLHDPKTGLKTGKKGYDILEQVQNIHTDEIYDIKKEPYGLFPELKNEDFLFDMIQEGSITDSIIGICIAYHSNCSDDNCSIISEEKLEIAKSKFEKKFRKYIGDLKPELMLNLYQSY